MVKIQYIVRSDPANFLGYLRGHRFNFKTLIGDAQSRGYF